jgi:transposase-like protein
LRLRRRALALARSRFMRGIAGDIKHTCPGCGKTFESTPGRVACSDRCRRGIQRLVRNMRLSRLPLIEREAIASMVALVHAAYRRIDEIQNPNNPCRQPR